jgi:hypothetical protein
MKRSPAVKWYSSQARGVRNVVDPQSNAFDVAKEIVGKVVQELTKAA